MANLATQLYATQNNGGSPRVLVSEVVALANGNATPATTTTAGIVKQATHIANPTTFADLTAATTAYNALLAALQVSGGPMAAS